MAGLDPNAQSLSVSGTVNITRATPSGAGPLYVQVLPSETHAHFVERYKVYEGTGASIVNQILADGFLTPEEGYRMAVAALDQVPTPAGVVVGRRDAADLTWGASAQAAIDAVPVGESPPWLGWHIGSRVQADIESVAEVVRNQRSPLVEGPLFIFGAKTSDEAVRTSAAGNVVETLRGLGDDTTLVCWSDLTRVQTPAKFCTALQNFDLAPDAGVLFQIALSVSDGALQTIPLLATRASVLGTGAEPFDFEPGEFLLVRIDDELTVTVAFEATALTILGSVDEPYAPTGQTFQIATETTAATTITLTAAETTRALAAAKINADLGEAIATDGGTGVLLTGNVRGTDGFVQVIEGTGGAALLGLAVSTAIGTGNVGNIDAVDMAEVVTIGQPEAGARATFIDESGAPRIRSERYGTSSKIEILAGSSANVLTELGYGAGQTGTGTGFAVDASATTAVELEAALATFTGLTSDSSTGRLCFETVAKGEGVSIDVDSKVQVDRLVLTSSGADTIGFSYDGLTALTTTSVSTVADAAALKVAFDADVDYTTRGSIQILADNSLAITWTDGQTHTSTDESTVANAVAFSTLPSAANAFGLLVTSFSGSGVAESWAEVRQLAGYLAYASPPLEEKQRPVDGVRLRTSDPSQGFVPHSGITKTDVQNIVNEGAWVMNPARSPARTFGVQMADGIKLTTRVTADLVHTALVREGVRFLDDNVDLGVFVALDQGTIDQVERLFRDVIAKFVRGNHVTPLKDPNDPSFDSERDGSITFPKLQQLTPSQIQTGTLAGIEVNLVAKAQLQKIDFTVNLVAATQAAV